MASNFQAYSNGYLVKIPGPQVCLDLTVPSRLTCQISIADDNLLFQVLGYMIQKTGADEAQLMPPKLPSGFFIPDDEYESVVNGGQPSRGVNTGETDPGGPAKGKRPNPDPTITRDKLRGVLDQMLDEKIGELFEKVSRV
jgi:hypothetical protein